MVRRYSGHLVLGAGIRGFTVGGTNGEKLVKMGNLFYGESGKQIGKFPIFPHFFKNFIYFYRIFLRSIGCILLTNIFV